MGNEEIKRRLRIGLVDVEREIEAIVNEYVRGEICLDEYLDQRVKLESKKWSLSLENLRRMRLRD